MDASNAAPPPRVMQRTSALPKRLLAQPPGPPPSHLNAMRAASNAEVTTGARISACAGGASLRTARGGHYENECRCSHRAGSAERVVSRSGGGRPGNPPWRRGGGGGGGGRRGPP